MPGRQIGEEIGEAVVDVGFLAPMLGSKPAGRPDWNCAVVRPVIPRSLAMLPAPWLGLVIPLVSVPIGIIGAAGRCDVVADQAADIASRTTGHFSDRI